MDEFHEYKFVVETGPVVIRAIRYTFVSLVMMFYLFVQWSDALSLR